MNSNESENFEPQFSRCIICNFPCGLLWNQHPPLFSEEINFLQLEDPIMASTLQGKKPREIEVLSGCIMCYLQMCTSLRHEETHG